MDIFIFILSIIDLILKNNIRKNTDYVHLKNFGEDPRWQLEGGSR
jgi:hypothetical protein